MTARITMHVHMATAIVVTPAMCLFDVTFHKVLVSRPNGDGGIAAMDGCQGFLLYYIAVEAQCQQRLKYIKECSLISALNTNQSELSEY
jgi:hypothetical protein